MTIKDIGKIAEGRASETIDGCVQLHDKNGFPVLELYAYRDESGNILTDDSELEKIAKELCILWNKETE